MGKQWNIFYEFLLNGVGLVLQKTLGLKIKSYSIYSEIIIMICQEIEPNDLFLTLTLRAGDE